MTFFNLVIKLKNQFIFLVFIPVRFRSVPFQKAKLFGTEPTNFVFGIKNNTFEPE